MIAHIGTIPVEEDAMQRRLETVCAVATILVVLAGCGGNSASSEPAKFKTSFGSAVNQFRDISRAIGTAIAQASSQTDAQIAATFQRLATRWQNQLSQLETLKPPSNLAADFNTLTGAAARADSDLNAVVAAARIHSKSAAEQATASMLSDIAAAKSASTTITNTLGIK